MEANELHDGKVYSKAGHGKFRNLRWLATGVLLSIYFIVPWIKVNGRHPILFDIPGRKFYILGSVYWPQDVFYFALLLIVLVGVLFLFTAIAGRLWCGYACPQSVFTDIFLAVERFIEGSVNKRQKLDHESWGVVKVEKKVVKHVIWLLISFAVAFTFVAYFIPAEILFKKVITGDLSFSVVFWLLFFTVTTYSFCALFRELICLVPCPYGRFQSALFDADTLVIGYDARRGEPRGHKTREESAEKLGDCIDCTLCVRVCPTGIDIRNGLQAECIACALCIDACDEVMEKIGRPKGLVRYTSMRALSGGAMRILRPRVIAYSLCMLALLGFFGYELHTRVPLKMQILRDRSSLYVKGTGGSIANVYTIRVTNMDIDDHRYRVSAVANEDRLKLKLGMGENPILVKSGEVYQGSLILTTRSKLMQKINHLRFVAESMDGKKLRAEIDATFVMP